MAFHYTDALSRVIDDVSRALPEFAHVRADALAISYAMARRRTAHGVFAKTVPLHGVSQDRPFRGGGPFRLAGRKVYYIIYFYLPRFHDQSFEDKLLTILHELYHLSPEFDGTLRLFPGNTPFHGPSRESFEAHLEPLTREYIRQRNGAPLLDFLRLSVEDLTRSYGEVHGLHIPMP